MKDWFEMTYNKQAFQNYPKKFTHSILSYVQKRHSYYVEVKVVHENVIFFKLSAVPN